MPITNLSQKSLWNKYQQALHKHGIPQKQWRWMVRWIQNYIRQVTHSTFGVPKVEKFEIRISKSAPRQIRIF